MSGNDQTGFVAVVPAGGAGTRMGGGLPKQYRVLAGKPVIAHTLATLLEPKWIDTVHVVVAPDDKYWQQDETLTQLTQRSEGRLQWHNRGGATRQETVLAGLGQIDPIQNPWVMVHDAARPGLQPGDLNALRTAVLANNVGALLATPVTDTVKIENGHNTGFVDSTTPRDGLWLAQTPQVFLLNALRDVLRQAQTDGASFTDEASAMESVGSFPELVPGNWRNFKLTTPSDIEKAQLVFAAKKESAGEKND